MGLRETIQDKPAVGYTLAAGVLALAAAVIFFNMRPAANGLTAPRWAFDLNTSKLFVAYAEQTTPINTDSGAFTYPGLGDAGAGVDAYVYSCGEPTAIHAGMSLEELAAVDAKVGLISRPPPPESDNSAKSGFDIELISDVTGQNWVNGQAMPGLQLRAAALEKCPNGEKPWLCVPY